MRGEREWEEGRKGRGWEGEGREVGRKGERGREVGREGHAGFGARAYYSRSTLPGYRCTR